ncbi:MAG: ParB N-terminal domain-containing protein [Promethearchaeota archaeon]
MGTIIDAPKLRMEIKFASVESLFTHEETIPSALETLQQEILEEQLLKHPIIVDKETCVVLDGMHRVAALKSLGCTIIPVCFVDYTNPAIELFAWYREFDGNQPFTELLTEISSREDLEKFLTSPQKANEIVKRREAMAALAHKGTAFLLKSKSPLTIKQIYDTIAEIEHIATQNGYDVFYSTEADALEGLRSKAHSVLIVPSLTKSEVTEGALKQQLFAHKTTRHVVPARPLFTNVPLSWLKATDLRKANRRLFLHLQSKQIITKNPGAIIDGRRYEECAYLFTDS